MIFYCFLMVSTILYISYSAYQDLKERMIYCFPCNALSVLWGIYLWQMEKWSVTFLVVFWMIHVFLYLFMNHFNVWGGGDSDFILLFCNVCLYSLGSTNVYEIAFIECISLCLAMLISITIGWLEGRIKRIKVNLKSEIAVVPGISIMMGVMILKEWIERWSIF